MPPFRIGINMAGAISAGAYTAGVLDFLTEAIDAWYLAKSRGEPVPPHAISLDVFSGASAGGMCAAISSVMLQEPFDHIHDTSRRDTSNRFYESWVNQIDIRELLKTTDLVDGQVVSLLDSSIISSIAQYALTPATATTTSFSRPWLSPDLTLFLSLTNLRGVPYSLNGAAPGSVEETTFFYGDRIRFQTTRTSATSPSQPACEGVPSLSPPHGATHYLNLDQPGDSGGWTTLQTAAMATGAFPLFLAPRILCRYRSEYLPPYWESVTSAAQRTPPPIPPSFPPGTPDPFPTLNVDGGVTNNDPFNYAHDYLNAIDPPSTIGHNQQKPEAADRAVISIAPFPTTDQWDPAFKPARNTGIFAVLPRLITGLISQSRFLGESLSEIMTGTTFSRFVIAPSDDKLLAEHKRRHTPPEDIPSALQCATLGAFGGFFERGFRAHDYALGRRNCQKFLLDHFILPDSNVLLAPALAALDPATRTLVLDTYKRQPPTIYAGTATAPVSLPDPHTVTWLPIIPLCSDAVRQPIPDVPRAVLTANSLDQIVDLLIERYRAVIPLLIDLISSPLFRFFLKFGQPAIRFLMRKPLTDALIKELGDSYQP